MYEQECRKLEKWAVEKGHSEDILEVQNQILRLIN